jgi:hypothetical protein
MDEFVKRPSKGPHLGVGQLRGSMSLPGRPIVVRTTTDTNSAEPLSVRPQLSQEKPKAEPTQPIIDLSNEQGSIPADTPSDSTGASSKPDSPQGQPPAKHQRRKIFAWIRKPRNKKEWIIFGVIVALLLAIIGGAVYWFVLKPDPAPVVTKAAPIKKAEPAPEPIYSTLTGLPITDKTINSKQVTAIQIENSPDARPQSGLKDAGIIFEAIAEGGITRFNAVYQDTAPDYIGPVRSIRPYYIDWFLPFDAALAHVGGSPQGLSDIKSLGVKDLDQFANSGPYTRITDRYAPHNVYTSIARLNELEASKGFNTSTYTGFNRKDDKKAVTPTAKAIDLAISSYYYNAHYDYDAATNSYLRSEGGEAHKDERSGAQLSPKVVVAIVMGRGIDGDGQHTNYQTVGSGHMYVFQDGTVTEGTWTKDARASQWAFTDAAGKAIAFNRGQTWFSMVDSTSLVTYTP